MAQESIQISTEERSASVNVIQIEGKNHDHLMAPQKVTLSLPPKVGREPGTKPVG